MSTEYIDRPPRIQPELPIETVTIPQPPQKAVTGRGLESLVMLAMPAMMIMGYLPALVSGQGNICTGLPMILGAVVMGIAALGQILGGRQNYARQKAAYEQRLKEMRKDLQVSHETQRFYYRHTFPDLPTIFGVAAPLVDRNANSSAPETVFPPPNLLVIWPAA